jgi:GntR family transcriptional regulator
LGDPASAARLDRRSPLPLWAQLRADLVRRLRAGAFDATFPGEMAERGRRPRLAAPELITQPLGTLYSLFAAVESAGLRQTSITRRQDLIADGVVADRLGLEASTPLFRLERLRLAGDEPLALDTAWLPGGIGAALLGVDFTHTSLYVELAARTGVRPDDGREHIRGVVPTAAERHLLAIAPATGALLINRVSYAAGRCVEWRRTLIRGDRFSLLAEFSARGGYRLAPDIAYPLAVRGAHSVGAPVTI